MSNHREFPGGGALRLLRANKSHSAVDTVIDLQLFWSGKNSCFLLFQSTLRSRNVFCVMSIMAQGAHRGRPVAAALCTPGLWPPKSPLRGAFDLFLQASGRAEAASLQITALSPHPCGLPRPSGNVSAILRPPTPAVSVSMVNKLKAGRTNRRSDKRRAIRQKISSARTPIWFRTSRPASPDQNRARYRTASFRRTAGWHR